MFSKLYLLHNLFLFFQTYFCCYLFYAPLSTLETFLKYLVILSECVYSKVRRKHQQVLFQRQGFLSLVIKWVSNILINNVCEMSDVCRCLFGTIQLLSTYLAAKALWKNCLCQMVSVQSSTSVPHFHMLEFQSLKFFDPTYLDNRPFVFCIDEREECVFP